MKKRQKTKNNIFHSHFEMKIKFRKEKEKGTELIYNISINLRKETL
jgi:hypothetical protein